MGVEKVAINSFILEEPEFISQASTFFGAQSIVAALDVKPNILGVYKVYNHAQNKTTNINPIEYATDMEKKGAGEILLTSVDKDGTMQGYDIDLIKKYVKLQ